MTRGFKSNREKAVDAHIATLRVGYLSAIAWRQAEWLCRLHIALDDARAARSLLRGLPAAVRQSHVDDALENRAARAELLEWCPAAARRAWHGKYAFLGHALPLSERVPTSRA